MDSVSLTADWHARWAGRVERIGAARNGLAVTTGLLGLAAVIEALARAAAATATPNQADLFFGLGLLYCVLGLATTLPLAFLRPAPAAVVLSAAMPAFAGPVPLPHPGRCGCRAGRGLPVRPRRPPAWRRRSRWHPLRRPAVPRAWAERAVPGPGARHRRIRGDGRGGYLGAHGRARGAGPGRGMGRDSPALARGGPAAHRRGGGHRGHAGGAHGTRRAGAHRP